MTGVIFDIKEFAVHDGPGLRTTVFFKGCPLRCVWCHNPEGLSPSLQLSVRSERCLHCGLCQRGCSHPECQPFGRCLHICPQGLIKTVGEEMTPDALVARLRRNDALFNGKNSVTFSGGEPLLQTAFLHEVLDRIPDFDVAIETSGYADPELFLSVIRRMNLVYMDIKLADDTAHRQYTGVSNARILKNLELLKQSGIPAVIRTPLIPDITDTPENLNAIRTRIGDLPWEQLPYNELAGAKYSQLGMEYRYDTDNHGAHPLSK